MSAPAAGAAREGVRRVAAGAWVFRCSVELEAEARFERLAGRMERLGDGAELVALARSASADERLHAELCAEQAALLGEKVALGPVRDLAEIAPAAAPLADRVLYEVVAACCVSETESMGVLTTLLEAARAPGLRLALQTLASDEVRHARLGWAYLARAHAEGRVAFLGPLVPAMLGGSVAPDLFEAASGDRDDDALLELGVLPHRLQREVFERTLEEVVFPGFERLGVETGPGRAWLAERRGPSRPRQRGRGSG